MDKGIKLLRDREELGMESEEEIQRMVRQGIAPVAWNDRGYVERSAIIRKYRKALIAYARSQGNEPDGRHVAVDCANRMASLATPQVIRALGPTVEEINTNVDGHFSARGSKPTPDSITGLRQFIAEGPATSGIAHDGNADRIILVDRYGEVIHEDTILAILAEHYVRTSKYPDPWWLRRRTPPPGSTNGLRSPAVGSSVLHWEPSMGASAGFGQPGVSSASPENPESTATLTLVDGSTAWPMRPS